MPIRELTEREKNRLLTQEEVDDLEDGAEVVIKWHGGNGPHRYELERVEGLEHPVVGDTTLDKVTDDPGSHLTKVFLPGS